jgi:hypothetical protein
VGCNAVLCMYERLEGTFPTSSGLKMEAVCSERFLCTASQLRRTSADMVWTEVSEISELQNGREIS